MREYTCTQCKTVFRRPAASTGLNAFCTTKCRKEFHGFKKHNKALGSDDALKHRKMLAKGEKAYQAALAASGKRFEDADVPAEGHLRVAKPETIVAGYGSTAAWGAVPGSASGRDDKVMREFPAELSVAPLRSIGEVAGVVVRKARARA